MISRLMQALLGIGLLGAPAAAIAADKPLVMESAKIKQLPAATTLQVNASGTGAASINIPHGTAPTSPTNGDCWTTTAGLYCRINGVTVSYSSGGSGTVTTTGSPASGNLAKFSGATSISNGDLSGDVTTSGTLATTLATTAVTAGSYTSANITVDAKGRLTAASNGSGGGGTTTNALTITSTGGASPGATFNGSAAKTIDYSTVGAAKTGAVTGSGLTMTTGRLLGRTTASSGAVEEIAVGTGLNLSGGTLAANTVGNTFQFFMPSGIYGANDTGAFATLADAFIPNQTFTVDQLIGAFNNATIGNVYSMFIATVSSSGVISGTVATAASRFTTVATGAQTQTFALSSPVTLNAGTRYILALVITSGTGTTANRGIVTSSSTTFPFPMIDHAAMFSSFGNSIVRYWYTQNSDTPTSGTPVSTASSWLYAFGVRGQL